MCGLHIFQNLTTNYIHACLCVMFSKTDITFEEDFYSRRLRDTLYTYQHMFWKSLANFLFNDVDLLPIRIIVEDFLSVSIV